MSFLGVRKIRWMMVLIAILPVTLVSLFFTVYMYQQRSSDGEINLNSRGIESVKYMASSAELAIYSGNAELLANMSYKLFQLPNVVHAAFYDNRRDLLSVRGEVEALTVSELFDCVSKTVLIIEDNWFFCREVVAELPVVDDFARSEAVLSSRIGWVVLALNTDSLKAYQQEVLFASITAGLLLMVLGGLLAAQFSLNLARPIRDLARRVQLADSDELPALSDMPVEELQVLRDAIESMLYDASISQEMLKNKVINATDELRRLNDDLQQRNELLQGTQKKLEQAAKSKDLFLARISHELRTPLTTVIGFSGLLKDLSHNALEHEYLDNISEATNSLLFLIDDILTLTKVSEGKLIIEEKMHETESFIGAIISQHAFAASEKELELLVNIDRSVPAKFVFDDQRLRQILNNFLSNAIKFTSNGEVALSVFMLPDQHEICFSVRDSGLGIAPENLDRLFQPFTQADESISRRFGGSGLGLSICKQLANLMKGRIELKSELGKGTEALIYLNVDSDMLVAGAKADVSNASVIAFDESALVRGSWRRSLSQAFNDLLIPSSRQSLLQTLDEQALDLVVLGLSGKHLNKENVFAQLRDVSERHEGKMALFYPVGQLADEIISQIQQELPRVTLLQKPLFNSNLVKVMDRSDNDAHDASTHNQALQDMHILVVEDQDILRRFLVLLLEGYGARVTAFAAVKEALAAINENPWDVILSDLHMPETNGEDFFSELPFHVKGKVPPFYIVTADSLLKEHRRLESIGVSGVISKPINEKAFIETLSKHHPNFARGEYPSLGLLESLIGQQEVIEELIQLSDAVAASLADNNWQAIRQTIHKIKGLAGVGNIHQLLIIAEDMGEAARAESTHDTVAHLEGLHVLIESFSAQQATF